MAYRVEVLCNLYSLIRGNYQEWRPTKPTGRNAKPYEWATEREAEALRGLCYDAAKWTTKVVLVPEGG